MRYHARRFEIALHIVESVYGEIIKAAPFIGLLENVPLPSPRSNLPAPDNRGTLTTKSARYRRRRS